jgi:hypothetical protein
VDVVRQANLALRFVLELAALAALGYWGATVGKGRLVRVGLAVGAPIVAAIGWVLFVAPNATFDVGPVARFVVELLVFGAATAGLAVRKRRGLALLLAGSYAVNRVLMAVWDQ